MNQITEKTLKNELLNKFNIKNLKEVPFINGRIATKKDFEGGKAVFYLQQDSSKNKSSSVKLGIPFFAYYNKKSLFGKKEIPIIVVQAERTVDRVVVGYIDKNMNKGVCKLEEIERIN